MENSFCLIRKAYEEFYRDLSRRGEFPYRSTRAGMWATSDAEEVFRAFRYFQVEKYRHLADLGSGDGKVVLLASLFTRATGYEIDEKLHHIACHLQKILGIERATFVQQDFLTADLSRHDLLYLYPDKPLRALEDKLHGSWTGSLLVHGPHFPPQHFLEVVQAPSAIGKFTLYTFIANR